MPTSTKTSSDRYPLRILVRARAIEATGVERGTALARASAEDRIRRAARAAAGVAK